MTLYHGMEYLTQSIQQNEAFLCLLDPTNITEEPPMFFCLIKNSDKDTTKLTLYVMMIMVHTNVDNVICY